MESYELDMPNSIMSEFLDESLVRLAEKLENRKEELRDCNGELSDLSNELDKYLDAWYLDISSLTFANGSSRHSWRTPYIVPCPSLHPIPYDTLKGLIEHSAGKVGLMVRIRLFQLHFTAVLRYLTLICKD